MEHFKFDAIAGMTVGIMAIPQVFSLFSVKECYV